MDVWSRLGLAGGVSVALWLMIWLVVR